MHEFNILDYKQKYKLNLGTKEITNARQIEEEQSNVDALHSAIAFFAYDKPGEEVKSPDFFAKVKEFGGTGSNSTWGKYLKKVGVKSRYSLGVAHYDFSEIEMEMK